MTRYFKQSWIDYVPLVEHVNNHSAHLHLHSTNVHRHSTLVYHMHRQDIAPRGYLMLAAWAPPLQSYRASRACETRCLLPPTSSTSTMGHAQGTPVTPMGLLTYMDDELCRIEQTVALSNYDNGGSTRTHEATFHTDLLLQRRR